MNTPAWWIMLGLALSSAAFAADTVTVYPLPQGEEPSDLYTLRVGGKDIPVQRCRVSAVPFNQVWPGYQRPENQTELAAFASWEMTGPTAVEITSRHKVESAVVSPASLKIAPAVDGNTIRFQLDGPRQFTVEINGPHEALHLFADPPEAKPPGRDDPNVRYFGPGVHKPGKIALRSNQTVYVAAGAVVYGCIDATQAKNIAIRGRGIIDTSQFTRGKGGGCIRLADCTDISIEGVVLRDPDVWCLSLFGCRAAQIANVKLIGLWRYNADGIDICNSQDVSIRDSFVRAFDDCIVLKGLKWDRGYDDRPVRNVRVSRCVIWNDWGRALEIGAETCAPEIRDVIFEDCDIIRTCHIAMDIQHGDRAVVRDIRFKNIRVQIDDIADAPRMQSGRQAKYASDPRSRYTPQLMVIVIRHTPYSKDPQCGNVRDVVFEEISVTGKRMPASSFTGLGRVQSVEGVTIRDLRFNGQVMKDTAEAGIAIGRHAHGVVVAP